ncbi:MAG: glycoside hydrolase family 88 protein [Bacteroidota bacterium]
MKRSIVFFALLLLGALVLMSSCKMDSKKNVPIAISMDSLRQVRYQHMLDYPLDSTAIPRSLNWADSTVHRVASNDWTSGFFPGNLWLIYELTGREAFKKRAMGWTAFIEREKRNGGTHDLGFMLFCSFGNGYRLTGNSAYKKTILESAKTLSTRFNSAVGSLRSWDFNADIWEFPVIVDNMMNLELLFEATRMSGDSTFHNMAVAHANTTLRNHFREDGSSYHVVVYDTLKGAVKEKVTHQGFNDDSAWARGQAWGIYGYTMSYRYTKNHAYLAQARKSADFYLHHPKLRDDGVPYWDFDDPAIPNAPRDVSAATIVASALFELYGYTGNTEYKAYAEKVLGTLKSEQYLLPSEREAPFILDHSTGNWPKKSEMDEPIVYGDYYYLEALLRSKGN